MKMTTGRGQARLCIGATSSCDGEERVYLADEIVEWSIPDAETWPTRCEGGLSCRIGLYTGTLWARTISGDEIVCIADGMWSEESDLIWDEWSSSITIHPAPEITHPDPDFFS
jgi:hypothetical protein